MKNTYIITIVWKIIDIFVPNKNNLKHFLLDLLALFKSTNNTKILISPIESSNVVYFIEQKDNESTTPELSNNASYSDEKQKPDKLSIKKLKIEVKSRSLNLILLFIFVLLVLVLNIIFIPNEFYKVLLVLLSFICYQTSKTYFGLK